MAHAVAINALIDGLIKSITNLDKDSHRFKKAKDLVAKGIRSNQYVRINQFDIEERYDGLDEKFTVLNRADLAEALKQRRLELENVHAKWKPEILALLLHLTDRPVDNTDLKSLALLKPPSSPPQLTWAEIIADDPLDETGIWNDIDYGAASSGDESEPFRPLELKQRAESAVAFVDDDLAPVDYSVKIDPYSLRQIRQHRFWDLPVVAPDDNQPNERMKVAVTASGASTISELETIRESLHMLSGLPTSLYIAFKSNQPINASVCFALSHSSTLQFQSILASFVDIGNDLFRLRYWVQEPQVVPLLQTFQHEVKNRLDLLDHKLSQSHMSYMHTNSQAIVSLQEIHDKVERQSRSLRRLAKIAVHLAASTETTSHMFLEELFEVINVAQLLEDKVVYHDLGDVFFSSLNTYMKPMRAWMETGRLGADTDGFFILEKSNQHVEIMSLWHDQFELRLENDGSLYAPSFLRPAVNQILNTGKSIYFLDKLGHPPAKSSSTLHNEPSLDFTSVCGKPELSSLQPFSQLFSSAFDSWTGSKYSTASSVLRDELFVKWDLWRAFDAIEHIYLCRDGYLYQSFLDVVFQRLDSSFSSWNDGFVLTDIARSVFGEVKAVESARLTVRSLPTHIKSRSIDQIKTFAIDYKLAWPLLEIIQRKSIRVYQHISRLITQTYRAKSVLQNCSIYQTLHLTASNSRNSVGLRHRMLCFVDLMRSFVTQNVIPSETARMRSIVRNAEDLDNMALAHAEYMNRLQNLCFLSKKLAPLHQAIMSVYELTTEFTHALSRMARGTPEPSQDSRSRSRYIVANRIRSRHKNSREQRPALPSSDDDDDLDEGYSGDEEDMVSNTDLREVMQSLQDQLDQLLPFIGTGVAELAKASGESHWEMLAEKLSWQLEPPPAP